MSGFLVMDFEQREGLAREGKQGRKESRKGRKAPATGKRKRIKKVLTQAESFYFYRMQASDSTSEFKPNRRNKMTHRPSVETTPTGELKILLFRLSGRIDLSPEEWGLVLSIAKELEARGITQC